MMSRILIVFALLCAGLSNPAVGSYGASPNDEHQGANDSSAQPVNHVVQWNRTLLLLVRTSGAQPPSVHATRSFAIMHAAIYDAVNAIADYAARCFLIVPRNDPPYSGYSSWPSGVGEVVRTPCPSRSRSPVRVPSSPHFTLLALS